MPSSLTPDESVTLARLLKKVAEEDKGFLPDEAYGEIHKLVPWPASEVCLMNNRGELLIQHRDFSEWGGKWVGVKTDYVPGGYIKVGHTFEAACREHLRKDGVLSDFEFICALGPIKWMPGEHPFATVISIPCVCMLRGAIHFAPGRESDFRFVSSPVESAIPRHEQIQRVFFNWLASQ